MSRYGAGVLGHAPAQEVLQGFYREWDHDWGGSHVTVIGPPPSSVRACCLGKSEATMRMYVRRRVGLSGIFLTVSHC
jgi:hypothetical protein